MKTVGIVQARMTSSRLPGKVLREVLGKPLLQYELERLRRIDALDEIVVATTTNADDDPVVALCERMGVATFRGSELDVLERFYGAARMAGADVVVRFTADCPLIDSALSERVIRHYLDHRDEVDYCGVDVWESYPRGTDTEVIPFALLEEAHLEGHEHFHRKHVTYFIWSQPARYRVWRAEQTADWSKYRLTVDLPEDFALVKSIIERLYPDNPQFDLNDIVELFRRNPELPKINAAVEQEEPEADD